MVKPILIWLCDKRRAGVNGVGSGRLSKRRVVRFVVLGAAAVTLAAYSAYAKRANRAMAAEQAISFADRMARAADFQPRGQDRQAAVQAALLDAAAQRSYALASVQPDVEIERPANPVIAATPAIPAADRRQPPKPKAAEAKSGAGAPRRQARRQNQAAAAAAAPQRRRRAGCSTTARFPASRAGCGSPRIRSNIGLRSKPRFATWCGRNCAAPSMRPAAR